MRTRFVTLLFVIISIFSAQFALSQSDLDNDGNVEIPSVVRVANDELQWYAQEVGNGELFDIGTFGQVGDLVHLGNWNSPVNVERAILKKLPRGELRLYSDTHRSGFTVDIASGDVQALLGADIDRSGLADAVLIHKLRRRLEWRFVSDPLSDVTPQFAVRQFGRKNQIPVLIPGRRQTQNLGVLRVRGRRAMKLLYRGFRRNRVRSIRFEKSPLESSVGVVRAVRGDDGKVQIAIKGNDNLVIFNRRGTLQSHSRTNGSLQVLALEVGRAAGFYLYENDGKLYPVDNFNRSFAGSLNGDPVALQQEALFPDGFLSATPIVPANPTIIVVENPIEVVVTIVAPTSTPVPNPTELPTVTPTPVVPSINTPAAQPSPTPSATPTVAQILQDCKAYLEAGFTVSAVYEIDPSGANGTNGSIEAYCDMSTSGGGWTLVLNYLHKSGVNDSLTYLSNALPLLGSSKLGESESFTQFWGHATSFLMEQFAVSELRFYCASGDSSRIVDFTTTDSGCIEYFRTGSGNCNGVANNFTPLAQHTAKIPAQSTSDRSKGNQGNKSMTATPFSASNNFNKWIIAGDGGADDYGCDNRDIDGDIDTYHQVWIR